MRLFIEKKHGNLYGEKKPTTCITEYLRSGGSFPKDATLTILSGWGETEKRGQAWAEMIEDHMDVAYFVTWHVVWVYGCIGKVVTGHGS